MENGYIKDDQLSSSSAYSDTRCCEAARGRLGITTHLRSNSWVPGAKDTTSWVKVDFITDTSVSGIMTQGGSDNQNDMWVINYTMSYSKDGQTFQHYLENNETKVSLTCPCLAIVLNNQRKFGKGFVVQCMQLL